MTRTDIVAQWWLSRVEAKSQLICIKRNELCRPMSASVPWKQRISTTTLWNEFISWYTVNDELPVKVFSKVGFMTMFYRISGAKMSTMRFNGGRIKVAKFDNISTHRKALGLTR